MKDEKEHSLVPSVRVLDCAPGISSFIRVRGFFRWVARVMAFAMVLLMLAPIVAEIVLRTAGIGVTTQPFVRTRGQDGRPIYVYNRGVFSRFIEHADRGLWDYAEFDVAAAKPRNAYRVFVFGGGQGWGWADSSGSFSHMLDVMLSATYPNIRFEIYNTSFSFMNSHVMRLIAEALPPLQPDLLIVYAGGNECIGSFRPTQSKEGVSHVSSRAAIDANVFLSDFRLVQALDGWKWLPLATASSMGPGVFFPDEPHLVEGVKASLRANLDAICAVGRQTGAHVLLCGEGANIRDWPPSPCRHQTPLTPEQLDTWTRTFEQGKTFEQAGDYSSAAESFTQAAGIDATYAEIPFRLGRCYWALGRYDEARTYLFRAFDMDALCWSRAHQWSCDVMKDLAQAYAADDPVESEAVGCRKSTLRFLPPASSLQPPVPSSRVHFVDGAQRLAERSLHGVPGSEFFGDQVHMTFEGSYEIACLLFENVVKNLPEPIRAESTASPQPLSIEECRERLAYDPAVTAQRLESGITQYRLVGVVGPLDMETRLDEVRKEALSSPSSQELARKAVELGGSDLYALAHWVDCAPPAEAEEALRKLLAAYPNRRISLRAATRVSARSGRIPETETAFRHLLAIYPDDARGYVEWGYLYQSQRDPQTAAKKFREACRLDPGDESACNTLGSALEALGEPEAAMTVYRQGIAANPWCRQPYEGLDRLLAAHGTPEASLAEWHTLIERYPDAPRAYFYLGVAMEKNGDIDQAIELFQKAVTWDGGNQGYKDRLAQTKAKKNESPHE